MAGTKIGGMKAAAKNIAREPGFYSRIGAKGGKVSSTGGFASYQECYCGDIQGAHRKNQCAGKRGGTVSRRRKSTL